MAFVLGLEEPGVIQYLEEPLKDPRQIPLLYQRCDKAVPFALDESLHTSSSSPSSGARQEARSLLDMEGLSAVVLKPTVLGGLDRYER